MITEQILKAATSGGRERRFFFGDHLDLAITRAGVRTLYCRYTHDGRTDRIKLGTYPGEVRSLRHAYQLRDKELNRLGIVISKTSKTVFPETPKKEDRSVPSRKGVTVHLEDAELSLNTTLDEAFDCWIQNVYTPRVSEKTRINTKRTYRLHIQPYLGVIRVGKITAANISDTLNAMEDTPSQQMQACSILCRIFDFLIFRSVLSYNPCFGLSKLYRNGNYQVIHYPSVKYFQLPDILHKFLSNKDICLEARFLFLFSLCTLLRPIENVSMEWSSVNESQLTMTIPPVKMKMRREFRLPITPLILKILRSMRRLRINLKNPYVFYSMLPLFSSGHVSRTFLSRLLKRHLGGILCPHGIRALGRGWLVDNDVPFDIAEMILSHQLHNKVATAYIRSDYLDQRRYWCEKWCQYITEQDKAGDIESLFQEVGELVDARAELSLMAQGLIDGSEDQAAG